MLVLVEGAAESRSPSYVQMGDPVRVLDRSGQRVESLMMEALAEAGVRTSRQCHGAELAPLLARRRAAGLKRVVVKPLDSAGSDDETVLVQEYLDGDEYIVNTVSRDGTHWFTDAWISRKTVEDGKRKVYDSEDLPAPDDPAVALILPYVSDCLDALGITAGPAHSELILTAEGPVLLETGARLSGLANPAALDRCTGANQVSLTLDCYTPRAEIHEDQAEIDRAYKKLRELEHELRISSATYLVRSPQRSPSLRRWTRRVGRAGSPATRSAPCLSRRPCCSSAWTSGLRRCRRWSRRRRSWSTSCRRRGRRRPGSSRTRDRTSSPMCAGVPLRSPRAPRSCRT